MNRSAIPTRGTLRIIARRAMVQRGLLPDFSSAVVAETDAIARAAVETDPSIRDLRDLTRYRKSIIQERTQHANRLHKSLEAFSEYRSRSAAAS